MAHQLSTRVRNARLDAIEAAIGASAIMRLRTGPPPANCAAADSGTVIATLALPADWMAAAAGGAKALAGLWQDASADAAGTIGHYRIYDSGGVVCDVQGEAGAVVTLVTSAATAPGGNLLSFASTAGLGGGAPANTPPQATAQAPVFVTAADADVEWTLAAATDPDAGDTLRFEVVALPAGGTVRAGGVELTAGATFTSRAMISRFATVTATPVSAGFTYRVLDQLDAASASATVTHRAQLPAASNVVYFAAEGALQPIPLPIAGQTETSGGSNGAAYSPVTIFNTLPARGKMAAPISSVYLVPGDSTTGGGDDDARYLYGDGVLAALRRYEPSSARTLAGGERAQRGGTYPFTMTSERRAAAGAVLASDTREIVLTDMNRAPRLNGGQSQCWGRADDDFVPLIEWRGYHALAVAGETISGVVTAIPGAGEGLVCVDPAAPVALAVGATLTLAQLQALAWDKRGVSSVSPGCRFAVNVLTSATGAPVAEENCKLGVTNFVVPAPLRLPFWCSWKDAQQGNAMVWCRPGGDWRGKNAGGATVAYGAVPFATTGRIADTAEHTHVVDVTGLGTAFLLRGSTGSNRGVYDPSCTDAAKRPKLRVTGPGGVVLADYPAYCWGVLNSSDNAWKVTRASSVYMTDSKGVMWRFDGAPGLATAIKVELVFRQVAGSLTAAINIFQAALFAARPGAPVTTFAQAAASHPSLILKMDSDADWQDLAGEVSIRHNMGSGTNRDYRIANGCWYSHIAQGLNSGAGMLRGFWKADGTGYAEITVARMVAWHPNYRPLDYANPNLGPGFSGKTPGPIAWMGNNQTIIRSSIKNGRGGVAITGRSMFTCRGQRGVPGPLPPQSDALADFFPGADYNYWLSGSDNGRTAYGSGMLKRGRWTWIVTRHKVNTVNADGTWARDAVYELYIDGRLSRISSGFEYRTAGNEALWDTFWFDEYNGGVGPNVADRRWPFVFGPTYVLEGFQSPPPPSGFSAPLVGSDGYPLGVSTPYSPDY